MTFFQPNVYKRVSMYYNILIIHLFILCNLYINEVFQTGGAR